MRLNTISGPNKVRFIVALLPVNKASSMDGVGGVERTHLVVVMVGGSGGGVPRERVTVRG